jgi:hypothetical protein
MILRESKMTPNGLFSTELEVFERHRSEWLLSHPGTYVAIQNDVIADGFFGSYAEALKAGLEKFDASRNFLIKQIWTTEPVYVVS